MRNMCRHASQFAVLICFMLSITSSLMAQQHGQYQPGQYGLNA